MDNYHLTKKDNQWNFGKENTQKPIKSFDTKADALDHAKDYMKEKGGSLKIHKEDGTIQEERTYPRSEDPKKTKG
ncbi:DUF2188 domain-containing protein [Chryseobacterium phocaeense]|uniref:DUF2188 domain-containing protein n=1 Tax=Chryseobacterium phocaeense TaxID=1816690 RepID=UPI0009BAADEF|nr:DUF2188 domain-containing protein [Chryseobacterium phocaeense]